MMPEKRSLSPSAIEQQPRPTPRSPQPSNSLLTARLSSDNTSPGRSSLTMALNNEATMNDAELLANSGISPKKNPMAGHTLMLSPSPKFSEPSRQTSLDDSDLQSPTTPRRPAFPMRGLSLQMPPRDLMSSNSASFINRIPLSPKLDASDTYGSQASVLPRRSRGLDFSRAATNLHHSTLAEQSSPDSSPTISGRGMNIPHRKVPSHLSGLADSPIGNSSLWSTMGNSDRAAASTSLGSINMMGSDSSETSSEDEDLMDADDIDESMITTPQISRSMSAFGAGPQASPGSMWMNGQSPAMSSLMNFQRARLRSGRSRRSPSKSNASSMASPSSKSPPLVRSTEGVGRQTPRRGSISWAANQLSIEGSESDENSLKDKLESDPSVPITPGRDGQRGVIRRVVTRRGNMLPKTKGFARIRAALLEEGAPLETEVRREADVVRQVRESDMDLEPVRHASVSTVQSSPIMGPSATAPQESLEDIPEDEIMSGADSSSATEKSLSGSFKQQVMKNSKGIEFWDVGKHQTPPPPAFFPRGSSSGISDDMSMESPAVSTRSSSLFGTLSMSAQSSSLTEGPPSPARSSTPQPTQAEIQRKVNNKRRRDDDFDPTSFKRRAVSPGMSVHNSPVMQSPMQRDGSVSSGSGTSSLWGRKEEPKTPGSMQKRVGLQGMTDTNDGLMKMSIE